MKSFCFAGRILPLRRMRPIRRHRTGAQRQGGAQARRTPGRRPAGGGGGPGPHAGLLGPARPAGGPGPRARGAVRLPADRGPRQGLRLPGAGPEGQGQVPDRPGIRLISLVPL